MKVMSNSGLLTKLFCFMLRHSFTKKKKKAQKKKSTKIWLLNDFFLPRRVAFSLANKESNPIIIPSLTKNLCFVSLFAVIYSYLQVYVYWSSFIDFSGI